jgi:hypothetical protein
VTKACREELQREKERSADTVLSATFEMYELAFSLVPSNGHVTEGKNKPLNRLRGVVPRKYCA